MLEYEIVDNGKESWVVFIHGLGGSTKTWKKQIDAFSEQYNLLLLDLPGHGLNADNVIYKVESLKLYDSIKATLDYLNIKNAHFVGLSLGTIVIANFAIYYPQYIKTIILGGSSLIFHGIAKNAILVANAIKRHVPYKFLYQFFSWFIMPRKHHKKSRTIFLREVVKLNKETMFAWIEYIHSNLHLEQILDKLDTIEKRILLISGAEDYCFLSGAKTLAKKMRSMDIKIIEKCGHICSIEKWSVFNHMALDYLAK